MNSITGVDESMISRFRYNTNNYFFSRKARGYIVKLVTRFYLPIALVVRALFALTVGKDESKGLMVLQVRPRPTFVKSRR